MTGCAEWVFAQTLSGQGVTFVGEKSVRTEEVRVASDRNSDAGHDSPLSPQVVMCNRNCDLLTHQSYSMLGMDQSSPSAERIDARAVHVATATSCRLSG